MKYILIKNGKVERVIIAEESFINSSVFDSYKQLQGYSHVIPNDENLNPQIGWNYDGESFDNPTKVYALVNSNIVTSVEYIHSDNLAQKQSENQFVVFVENLDPMPATNWAYDGESFTEPQE